MLCMSGLDYEKAPIALRERLSFTKSGVTIMDQTLCRNPAVGGVVLLSTCNRTELYLVCREGLNPGALLCEAAGVPASDFAGAFVTRRENDCVRHLLEVACGLRSQILGEDQILTQVKTAVTLAREAGTAAPELETLFRVAAACGKAAKNGGRLTRFPASAAHQAVKLLEARLGSLKGRCALVIGNGEMGRLAASVLRDAGCAVTVTLRAYRHGETVVPAGCAVTQYDNRYEAMSGTDILLSATVSPHYTVAVEPLLKIKNPPRFLVDLAIPRDIQPEVGEMPGITLLNMDDLGQGETADGEGLARVEAVVEEYLEEFRQWSAFRESLPAQQTTKAALLQRVSRYISEDTDPLEAAQIAINRTVELLAGSFKEHLTARDWEACAEKIQSHTR